MTPHYYDIKEDWVVVVKMLGEREKTDIKGHATGVRGNLKRNRAKAVCVKLIRRSENTAFWRTTFQNKNRNTRFLLSNACQRRAKRPWYYCFHSNQWLICSVVEFSVEMKFFTWPPWITQCICEVSMCGLGVIDISPKSLNERKECRGTGGQYNRH